MQTQDNTPMCYQRENQRTRRKPLCRPPSGNRSTRQSIWIHSKKPSKPNLPDVPKPSKLLLQRGYAELLFCLALRIPQQAPCCIYHPWLLPMLPSSTKFSLDTLTGCGKCLGYQPLNNMEIVR